MKTFKYFLLVLSISVIFLVTALIFTVNWMDKRDAEEDAEDQKTELAGTSEGYHADSTKFTQNPSLGCNYIAKKFNPNFNPGEEIRMISGIKDLTLTVEIYPKNNPACDASLPGKCRKYQVELEKKCS